MRLIYEKSRAGRRASRIADPGVPAADVPAALARRTPPRLPEMAEPEIVRHFTELSTRTFGIDTGFYPLGSCTMKYNPRINERAVGLPGFRPCTRTRRTTEPRARSSSCGGCRRCWPRWSGSTPSRCSPPPGRRAS